MNVVSRVQLAVDSTQVRGARRELDGMRHSGQKAETSVAALGKRLLGFAAVTATLTAASRTTADFTQSLADLSAITGAAGDDLEYYKRQAMDIGRTTSLSASQAVTAYKLIASAKPDLLSNAEALDAVTRSAVTLAEATGMQLTDSASALGSALNQFQIDASEADDVINILAASSKQGTAEVNAVTEALRNSGSAANALGVDLAETVAGIQALAKAGRQGSDAGTGLNQVLLRLEKTGDNTLMPSVVGLSKALDELGDRSLSTTELMKMFGDDAFKSATALIAQRDTVRELNKTMRGTSVAAEQASTRMDTLTGDVLAFGSSVEGLTLTAFSGDVEGLTRKFVQLATQGIRTLTEELEVLQGIGESGVLDAQIQLAFDAMGLSAEEAAIQIGAIKFAATESMSFIELYAINLKDTLWSAFIDFPANFRTLFSVILGEMEKLDADFREWQMALVVVYDIGMEKMKHGTELIWIEIKHLFQTGVESVLGEIARLIEFNASIADAIGLDSMAEKMNTVASGIRGTVDAEQNYRNSLSDANTEYETAIALIQKEFREQQELAELKRSTAQGFIDDELALRSSIIARRDSAVLAAKEKYEQAKKDAAIEAARKTADKERLDALKREEEAKKNATAATIALSAATEAQNAHLAISSMTFEEIADALLDEYDALTLTERGLYISTLATVKLTDEQKEWLIQQYDINEALKIHQEEQEKSAATVERASESISNSLTDALMRGFEDGADFAGNFIDTLKNMFNTLILRPIIQPIATGLAGAVTGALMPGSASASGAGGGLGGLSDISSLFGGNSFASSLNGIAEGLFGFGGIPAGGAASAGVMPVAGGMSNASSAIFGGSNLAIGGAGLLGGFAADAIFGGKNSGTFGGIGSSLGYSLAAGSAASGGMMAGLGAAAGPVGAIAGMVIGGLLGKIGGKPSDKTQWAGFTGADNALFAGGESGEKFSQESRDAASQMAQALQVFNAGLGQFAELTESFQVQVGERDGIFVQMSDIARADQLGQSPNGSKTLEDAVTLYQGSNAEDAMEAAFDHIWENFLETTESFSASMLTLMTGLTDAEERLTAANSFGAIQSVLDADVFANYASAVELANRTLWDVGQDQYNSVLDLASAYDGSIAATQELASATVQRYQTELALLAQIDSVVKNTDATFASSRQQFELAGLNAEETYNYWKSIADQGAIDLTTLIDPAEIESQINEIANAYSAAWRGLDTDQQTELKTEYLEYINDLEAARDERLNAAEEQIRAQAAEAAAETNQALSTAAARFLEAANTIAEAATAMSVAAATPTQIEINMPSMFGEVDY